MVCRRGCRIRVEVRARTLMRSEPFLVLAYSFSGIDRRSHGTTVGIRGYGSHIPRKEPQMKRMLVIIPALVVALATSAAVEAAQFGPRMAQFDESGAVVYNDGFFAGPATVNRDTATYSVRFAQAATVDVACYSFPSPSKDSYAQKYLTSSIGASRTGVEIETSVAPPAGGNGDPLRAFERRPHGFVVACVSSSSGAL
jgi:hypothetical protein